MVVWTRRRARSASLSAAAFGISARGALLAALVLGARSAAATPAGPTPDDSSAATGSARSGLARRLAGDSLFGRSGKLRARFLGGPPAATAILALSRLFGDSAVARPGVYTLPDSAAQRPFSLITLVPFSGKSHGRVGEYRIGYWPAEKGRLRSTAYVNPTGFIEVTRENQDTPISEHFRLRDFLTHDQDAVWPKYLVLREALIDKLELVISDLQAHGHPVRHVAVMSGFRSPQYNARGVGRRGGRARDSRHQYGDAADIFIDNDGDGRLDDLNHDGRLDVRDTRVIAESVERVEAAHPDLVGGLGVYRGTRRHGPFVHIDVRGTRARWGRA